MVTVDELKQRGMAAFQASQFESAASLFDQARKLAPKDPDVWNMLAVTSSILGD
ncbi:MAG TPA: tetratricopeptide repeat protein, partial [Chromatiales bacterium]|nr:tetratricopeptide repeat protein [Chromatiales bacterium]